MTKKTLKCNHCGGIEFRHVILPATKNVKVLFDKSSGTVDLESIASERDMFICMNCATKIYLKELR